MEFLAGLLLCVCIFLKFKLDELKNSYKYLEESYKDLESANTQLTNRCDSLYEQIKNSCITIEKKEIEINNLKNKNEKDWDWDDLETI
jgi:chromosome segregation ATPase